MSTTDMQQQLHTLVSNALAAEGTPEVEKYKSVVGMVYTLVEDGRIEELHTAIKNQFPEYYH